MDLQKIRRQNRDETILWARRLLENDDFVVLDTETTGLDNDDEAVSIGVVNKHGDVLFDTLLRHQKHSHPQALATHGHTWKETRHAPHFLEIWPNLVNLIEGKPLITYNLDFDLRILRQTIWRYNIHAPRQLCVKGGCAMEQFSAFYGKWNHYYLNFKWQKLSTAARHFGITVTNAHNAAADALTTLRVVERMAMQSLSAEEKENA